MDSGLCQESSCPAASPGPFSSQFIKLFRDWIVLGLASSTGTIVSGLTLHGGLERERGSFFSSLQTGELGSLPGHPGAKEGDFIIVVKCSVSYCPHP